MRGLASVAAAMTVAGALVIAPSANAEQTGDDARCKGRKVTINGTPKKDHIVGTPGRDVIRTWKGNDVIDGRGGNDVICSDEGADTLRGGAGDDRLHGGPFKLIDYVEEWGAKGDLLIGGTGDDLIVGGGSPKNEQSVMPEFVVPDRVEFPGARGGITITGRGVVTGKGIGRDRLFDTQQITGTQWGDRITVRGERIVAGKGGDDDLSVLPGRRDPQLWPAVVGHDGDDRVDLSRYDRSGYELSGGAGRDRLLGSPKSDYLSDLDGSGVARGGGAYDQIYVTSKMSVHGQGGNDLLQVTTESGSLNPIDGGSGRDRLELTNPTREVLRLDVPDQRLTVGDVDTSVRRAESYYLLAERADAFVRGTDRGERIWTDIAKGYTVHARLGGGDDRYTVDAPIYAMEGGRSVAYGGDGADVFSGGDAKDRHYGEAGDDEFWAGFGNDEVYGGDGNDEADGGPGNDDLCRAESTSRCER